MAVGKDEERAMTLPPDDEFELEIEREPLEEPSSGTSAGGQRGGVLLASLRGRPRRRGIEALAVVGALAVAVVIALSSIRGATLETSIAPTATPAPEQAVLASNVTFGAFTLNGKLLKGPPPRLVTLRQGRNTVTLSAPPFQPKTCTLIWPGQQPVGNACQMETGGQQFVISGQTVTPSLALYVLVGAGDLPPELASSAQAAVTAALGNVRLHTTVPRGDYFATKVNAKGVPVARRASSALSADLRFLLYPPDGSGAGPCGPFGYCPSPLEGQPFDSQQETQVPDNIWFVSVMVAMQWTFTPTGQAPLVAAPIELGGGPSLWLAYDGTGGWQVTVSLFGDGTGQTLSDQLRQGICWAGATLLGNMGGPGQHQFGMGTGGDGGKDQGVDGCVIQLFPNDGSSPSSPSGNVIWRFGALLAADAGAQKLLPMLPAAPDSEIKAVTR